MDIVLPSIVCSLTAIVTSASCIPHAVLLAYRKGLLDIPNARKLQKHAVPVIGGLCIYLSILVSMFVATIFLDIRPLMLPLLAITTMFFIGFFDDMMDISFRSKFIYQTLVIVLLWYNGIRIDTFCGLFGIWGMNESISLLLSIFAGVGLMNAINLIDGVDGLASGYGMGLSLLFSAFFFLHADMLWGISSLIIFCSLLPVFVCNVFSKKYKMFIGDSGSLILGILAYIVCSHTLHEPIMYNMDRFRVSMLLAFYAIPVFDTLRVMTGRMFCGKSPFLPDKTHLHHALLSLRYPHLLVTAIEILIDSVIFGFWVITVLLCLWLDIAPEWQFLAMMLIGPGIVVLIYINIQKMHFYRSNRAVRHIAFARKWGRRIKKPALFIRALIDGRLHSWKGTVHSLNYLNEINGRSKKVK